MFVSQPEHTLHENADPSFYQVRYLFFMHVILFMRVWDRQTWTTKSRYEKPSKIASSNKFWITAIMCSLDPVYMWRSQRIALRNLFYLTGSE